MKTGSAHQVRSMGGRLHGYYPEITKTLANSVRDVDLNVRIAAFSVVPWPVVWSCGTEGPGGVDFGMKCCMINGDVNVISIDLTRISTFCKVYI